MTRVLVTYADPQERRLAAHHAVCLARHGVDVDVAAHASIPKNAADRYHRTFAASSADLVALAATAVTACGARPGDVRIVGADLGAPRIAWATPAGILVGLLTAVALVALGAPWLYPPLLGALTAAATTHMFRTLGGAALPAQDVRRSLGRRADPAATAISGT